LIVVKKKKQKADYEREEYQMMLDIKIEQK